MWGRDEVRDAFASESHTRRSCGGPSSVDPNTGPGGHNRVFETIVSDQTNYMSGKPAYSRCINSFQMLCDSLVSSSYEAPKFYDFHHFYIKTPYEKGTLNARTVPRYGTYVKYYRSGR